MKRNFLKKKVIAYENLQIALALIQFNNNKDKSAKYLGISRATIYDRLDKYGDYIYGFANNKANIKAFKQ